MIWLTESTHCIGVMQKYSISMFGIFHVHVECLVAVEVPLILGKRENIRAIYSPVIKYRNIEVSNVKIICKV